MYENVARIIRQIETINELLEEKKEELKSEINGQVPKGQAYRFDVGNTTVTGKGNIDDPTFTKSVQKPNQ